MSKILDDCHPLTQQAGPWLLEVAVANQSGCLGTYSYLVLYLIPVAGIYDCHVEHTTEQGLHVVELQCACSNDLSQQTRGNVVNKSTILSPSSSTDTVFDDQYKSASFFPRNPPESFKPTSPVESQYESRAITELDPAVAYCRSKPSIQAEPSPDEVDPAIVTCGPRHRAQKLPFIMEVDPSIIFCDFGRVTYFEVDADPEAIKVTSVDESGSVIQCQAGVAELLRPAELAKDPVVVGFALSQKPRSLRTTNKADEDFSQSLPGVCEQALTEPSHDWEMSWVEDKYGLDGSVTFKRDIWTPVCPLDGLDLAASANQMIRILGDVNANGVIYEEAIGKVVAPEMMKQSASGLSSVGEAPLIHGNAFVCLEVPSGPATSVDIVEDTIISSSKLEQDQDMFASTLNREQHSPIPETSEATVQDEYSMQELLMPSQAPELNFPNLSEDLLSNFWCKFSDLCQEGFDSETPWVYGRDEAHVRQMALESMNNAHSHTCGEFMETLDQLFPLYLSLWQRSPDDAQAHTQAAHMQAKSILAWGNVIHRWNTLGNEALKHDYSRFELKSQKPEQDAPPRPHPIVFRDELTHHHHNFNGDKVALRSMTDPADSCWAAKTTTLPKLKVNDFREDVSIRRVLAAQAFKFVDPVRSSGFEQIEDLQGSMFRDAVVGSVKVLYQPGGTWAEDMDVNTLNRPLEATESDGCIYACGAQICLHRPIYLASRENWNPPRQEVRPLTNLKKGLPLRLM
ncbi:uncharacterized protein KY384_007776 [Bacidia gigantensis]|uniref:uncharacterized protein n=1 Tax=Bacidia gigantensis TaxID=2732470 RepID=UPI001D03CA51|nr:uncharacterized protein KY384_007776 [Bacidia gigantensis]KAG8527623.1 hypothetical protein KY384_007776 [Bacidia gigantensis]